MNFNWASSMQCSYIDALNVKRKMPPKPIIGNFMICILVVNVVAWYK